MPRASTNWFRDTEPRTQYLLLHTAWLQLFKRIHSSESFYIFMIVDPGTFMGMNDARFFCLVCFHDSLVYYQGFWHIVTFRTGNVFLPVSLVFFDLVRQNSFSSLLAKAVAYPARVPTTKIPGNLAPFFHPFGTAFP